MRTLTALPFFLMFFLAFADGVDAKPSGSAKATFVKGDVQVSKKAAGPFKKLRRGRKVKVGQFVKTGKGARLELKFKDGSVVRVAAESLVHLNAAARPKKGQSVQVETELVGGKVWANVAKLSGDDARFAVKTENAVAGVRGTIFRVNIDKDKASVVRVYDGSVAVSNSPFFASHHETDSAESGNAKSPFEGRKEIKAPFEQVSKKEWEQIVAKMMQVRVSADGTMSNPASFTAAQEEADAEAEWVRWNQSCDNGACDDF